MHSTSYWITEKMCSHLNIPAHSRKETTFPIIYEHGKLRHAVLLLLHDIAVKKIASFL